MNDDKKTIRSIVELEKFYRLNCKNEHFFLCYSQKTHTRGTRNTICCSSTIRSARVLGILQPFCDEIELFFLDHHLYWFSYTDPDGYCRNITQVGDHLYIGLKQFFELFPWLQQMEFFITGESFAGKYIPSIGNAIWEGNKDEDFIINLQVWPFFFHHCIRTVCLYPPL